MSVDGHDAKEIHCEGFGRRGYKWEARGGAARGYMRPWEGGGGVAGEGRLAGGVRGGGGV